MKRVTLVALCAAALVLEACPTVRMPELMDARRTTAANPGNYPLKVHLRSGDLLVLGSWSDLPGDSGLAGVGLRYDVRRRPVGPFNGRIARDSIALLEMTRSQRAYPAGSAVLGVYTVLAGAVTIACLADPKSCFGSCPTFYLDDRQDRPDAEGFSGSVARSLEASDVDYLADAHVTGRTFAVTMRNEALETHAVRSVRLLVVARPEGGSIVAGGDGRLYAASQSTAPTRCESPDGDCAALVARRDGREWFTRADSTDLGASDSIDLIFPAVGGPAALVVTARQSLASTYVFYQSLAYAGSRAGELLAAVEREGTSAFGGAWTLMRRLGSVEVLLRSADGTWLPVGAFGEPGPIAADRQAVPLGSVAAGPVRLRLRFARGAWRFDELGLVALGSLVHPIALDPARVERDGVADALALARLRDPNRYLVTDRGDRYRIVFDLPADGENLEFFLESTGYYYEWMRPEWLREENPALLALIAVDPAAALRAMAPGYARLEPRLEELFWASRFGGR
ncbi:MAG: hypothetical protein Q8S13_14435 [Dehalococcoidia bacterium]|nr:hypothetical protein [Dehalococcoidia bacterium]